MINLLIALAIDIKQAIVLDVWLLQSSRSIAKHSYVKMLHDAIYHLMQELTYAKELGFKH